MNDNKKYLNFPEWVKLCMDSNRLKDLEGFIILMGQDAIDNAYKEAVKREQERLEVRDTPINSLKDLIF